MNPLLPSKSVLDLIIRKHDRPLWECRKAERTQTWSTMKGFASSTWILDLELCGVTKVLKYLTVFVRNCDFHGWISFWFLAFIRIAANLDGRTMLHPLNAVFWGMKPQNNRQSKPKPAVFLMDFASEMLLFLFKNRKNSSLCPWIARKACRDAGFCGNI